VVVGGKRARHAVPVRELFDSSGWGGESFDGLRMETRAMESDFCEEFCLVARLMAALGVELAAQENEEWVYRLDEGDPAGGPGAGTRWDLDVTRFCALVVRDQEAMGWITPYRAEWYVREVGLAERVRGLLTLAIEGIDSRPEVER